MEADQALGESFSLPRHDMELYVKLGTFENYFIPWVFLRSSRRAFGVW